MNMPYGADAKEPKVGGHEKQQKHILYWLDKCRRYGLSLAVGLIGLALSLTAFFVVNQWETQSRKQGFERFAEARCQLFEKEVKWNLIRLKALKLFFDGSQFVDRNEYSSFVEPLHEETQHPVAFYWAPRVLDSDRHSFEKAVQAEGYADFSIHRNSPTDSIAVITQHREYYPVLYRCDDANWALAFDITSRSNLKQAIEKTIDINQPVATTSAILLKGQKDWPGVCLFYPVYHKGLPITTFEDRRLAVEGVVTCVIQVGDILDHILHVLSPTGIDMEIADISTTEGRQSLYHYKSRLKSGDTGNDPNEGSEASGLVYTTTFDFADRTWEMRVTPSLAYLDIHSVWVCWIVFWGGLLLTALMMIQFHSMRARTIIVERLVIDRTAQLQESNERFQIAFETANIAICLVDCDSRFILVNNQMCTMYGYSREEFLSMTVRDITHPDYSDVTPQFIRRASSVEIDHQRFIKRYIHKEGHFLWGEVSSSVVRDAKGNPLYFISYVLDITERKQAEEKLLIKDFAFKSSLSADSIGNNEGFLIHANPAFSRIWGYENVDEVIGKPILDFLADKDDALEIIESINNTGKWEGEYTALRKDGSTFIAWFFANAIYDVEGNQTALYSSVVDITERKQAEESLRKSEAHLRTLVETIPDMIWLKDPDGVFLSCNRKLEQLYGAKAEDIIGKTDFDFVSRELATSFRTHDQLAVKAGKPTMNEEEITFANDGHKELLETIKTPMFDPDGSLIGVLGIARNITKRKQTEKILRESEEKYRLLADNTVDCIWKMDKDLRFTYINKAVLFLFGFTPEEWIGSHLCDRCSAEDMKKVETIILEVMKEKNTNFKTFAMCLHHKNGREIDVEVIGKVLLDANGNIAGYQGTTRDITERKQAHDALQQSENDYKAATEAGRIAVWRVELPDGIVDSGGALERLLGYEPGEIDDWKKINHPEDKDRLEKLWKDIFQKKTDRYDVEQRLLCKDGNFKWFSASGQVVWNDDTKGAIIGTTQDINERKLMEKTLEESEEKFRAISSSAHDAIVMIDNDGNITYWNDAAEGIFGQSANEVYGRNFHEMFVPERFHDQHHKGFSEFQNTGKGAAIGKTIEVAAYRKDGTEFPVDLSLSSVKLNEKWHAIVIVRNITERKQSEEKRISLEVEVNQARKLEAVGSLAAGIAHEINTPIQFVGDNTNFIADSFKSMISLIESYDGLWQEANAGGDLTSLDSKRVKAKENADLDYLKEEIPAAIEQTLDGVQRVTKIVRAMKDFAHSDQGTKSMSNLNDMLESTLTVARNELKYVADVETDFGRELPNIECYRDDLNQVFLNLLINAAHTIADVVGDASAGKGTITISTERDDDNVIIRISDTGKGIPQSIQNRVFDPFFSTKDVGKGSGQGLAIARKIVVEKHEGSLDFETEKGKGTTFIIRLPIAVPEVVEGT